MAVTYQIDQAKRRIHTRCVGAVTFDEVQQHFADLARDPECPERLDVLLDLSEITSLPTSSQLSAVTTEIARVRPRVQFDGCAIIASRDAVFGMARMFEVFAESYFRATRVFRTVDEGTRWLELEPVARCSGATHFHDIGPNGEVLHMQFMLIIYNDDTLLDALPAGQADAMMRDCFAHADELRQEGHLIESRMLQGPERAKSVRIRHGRSTATDGPFAEAKEVLGGFNLIEAKDMDEAIRIASAFPWARTGCVEIRPVEDIESVRRRVGASPAPTAAASIPT